MSFKTAAILTALVAFVLGLAYLFAGGVMVGRWGLDPTGGVLLLGRRMGCLYLGLSAMYFLARSAPASLARTALAVGAATTLALLALSGILEFAAHHAGAGILVSAAIELLLGLAFVASLVRDRRLAFAR